MSQLHLLRLAANRLRRLLICIRQMRMLLRLQGVLVRIHKKRYAKVMSHMWMSHVAHVKEAYILICLLRMCMLLRFRGVLMRTLQKRYVKVMSHIWMSHVAHVNEAKLICLIRVCMLLRLRGALACLFQKWYAKVISHVWISHGTHVNEAHVSYEWVMSHMWQLDIIYTYIQLDTYVWHMRSMCMAYVSGYKCIWEKLNYIYPHIILYTHIYDIYIYSPYRKVNVSQIHMRKVVRWSHVTHMNESWHTGLGKCITWMSHGTHVTAWFYIYIYAPWYRQLQIDTICDIIYT